MYIHIYMYVLIYIYTYKHIPQRCDIGKETLSNCTCIFSQVSRTFQEKRTKYRALSRFLQKSPIHSRLVQKSPTFRHLLNQISAKDSYIRFLHKSPIHVRFVQKSPTFRHLINQISSKEPIFPHFVVWISTRCKITMGWLRLVDSLK